MSFLPNDTKKILPTTALKVIDQIRNLWDALRGHT